MRSVDSSSVETRAKRRHGAGAALTADGAEPVARVVGLAGGALAQRSVMVEPHLERSGATRSVAQVKLAEALVALAEDGRDEREDAVELHAVVQLLRVQQRLRVARARPRRAVRRDIPAHRVIALRFPQRREKRPSRNSEPGPEAGRPLLQLLGTAELPLRELRLLPYLEKLGDRAVRLTLGKPRLLAPPLPPAPTCTRTSPPPPAPALAPLHTDTEPVLLPAADEPDIIDKHALEAFAPLPRVGAA